MTKIAMKDKCIYCKEEECAIAMQDKCIYCKKEQFGMAVFEISHGRHPCCWCGKVPPPLTPQAYQEMLKKDDLQQPNLLKTVDSIATNSITLNEGS